MWLEMWMTSYPEAMGWDSWWFLKKKHLVEIWTQRRLVDFRASARRGQLGLHDAPRVVGSDGTVSIVEIVSLFPRVENLKVKKVIKVSYLNYRESSVFRVKDIDTRLTKAWTAIDRLSIIWKSDLTDKMKRSFFQAAVVSILLYGCTTWTLTKRLEKKLDGNYTRILRAILNNSWRQHPRRHQLYGHLPPITKTIQVRRNRYAGHCWRSRDKYIVMYSYGPPHMAGQKQDDQQVCEDTGCSPEDLPEAMNDREKWRERVWDIRACGTT